MCIYMYLELLRDGGDKEEEQEDDRGYGRRRSGLVEAGKRTSPEHTWDSRHLGFYYPSFFQ